MIKLRDRNCFPTYKFSKLDSSKSERQCQTWNAFFRKLLNNRKFKDLRNPKVDAKSFRKTELVPPQMISNFPRRENLRSLRLTLRHIKTDPLQI